MTSEPRAFLAIDRGSATLSAALIGRVDGAWRLLGNLAAPSAGDLDVLVERLVARVADADPEAAAAVDVTASEIDRIPRLEVTSHSPRRLAVLGGSDRAMAELRHVAARSGWRVDGASVEATDPLAMTRLLLDPGVDAILVGAADPPRNDERSGLRELAALVAAVAHRRPTVPIILAGAMAEGLEAFGDVSGRAGGVILAPAVHAAGDPLATLLTELALPADDPRRTIGIAAGTLAEVLARRVEVIVLGHDASVRVVAAPAGGGGPTTVDLAIVPGAAVAPSDPDDVVVDGVLLWSTTVSDRHRIRDRMRELRIAPWADAAGDGAALRMAASRAALVRLVAATGDERADDVPPDLVVTTSGTWSAVPAPTVALTIVDVVRRSGASQFALDHARLLAVLGAIPDPGERRTVLRDLIDDLLAPLGTVVTPAGLRAGRSAGSLTVHSEGGASPIDLLPGGLELVDLAPGQSAVAEFRFRDTVRLATRGRHFEVEVAGGLGGLLVDLRDVPLRLPERTDRRRDLLAAWQSALWTGAE